MSKAEVYMSLYNYCKTDLVRMKLLNNEKAIKLLQSYVDLLEEELDFHQRLLEGRT